MSKILAFANQKGGVGKTTLSMSVAGTLASWDLDVLVVDADLQQSASSWSTQSDEKFPADIISLGEVGKDINAHLEPYVDKYDVIIVDCPPSAELESNNQILLVCDLVIVPIAPSPLDIWSAIRTVEQTITAAQKINTELEGRLVLNQYLSNTSLSQLLLEAVESDEQLIPVLETRIHQRVAYRHAALAGVPVQTFKSRAQRAIYEIEMLSKEIMEILIKS